MVFAILMLDSINFNQTIYEYDCGILHNAAAFGKLGCSSVSPFIYIECKVLDYGAGCAISWYIFTEPIRFVNICFAVSLERILAFLYNQKYTFCMIWSLLLGRKLRHCHHHVLPLCTNLLPFLVPCLFIVDRLYIGAIYMVLSQPLVYPHGLLALVITPLLI